LGADWLIDNVRIGGSAINPDTLVSHFDPINDEEWLRSDNVDSDTYCGSADVAMGITLETEDSVLTSRDIHVSDNHMLQFEKPISTLGHTTVRLPPSYLNSIFSSTQR
jgi:hypothetical protein